MYDHVLLTFLFDTPVSPMFVELDFVRCPEWQIGAPGIDVYSSNDTNLAFDLNRPLRGYWPPVSSTVYKTSCDSLSTVQVRLKKRAFHIMWFIIVSFANEPDIEWVNTFLASEKYNFLHRLWYVQCPSHRKPSRSDN